MEKMKAAFSTHATALTILAQQAQKLHASAEKLRAEGAVETRIAWRVSALESLNESVRILQNDRDARMHRANLRVVGGKTHG